MESQEGGKFPGAEPRIFYGYYIIAASLLIMTAIWGLYYAFGIFFKPMLNEFGWSRAMTSGAFSLASIVSGVLAIAMGSLTDKFGPRIVITLCGLLLGIGSFLISQISALWQLYLFYGLIVGTGMGGGYGPLLSTAARWFVKRRGLMSGFVTAGIGMGGIIVPLVASRLISAYGWRHVVVGGITGGPGWLLLPRNTQAPELILRKRPCLNARMNAWRYAKSICPVDPPIYRREAGNTVPGLDRD